MGKKKRGKTLGNAFRKIDTSFVKPDRYKTDICRLSFLFSSFMLDEAATISILNAFSVRLADISKGPSGSSVRRFTSVGRYDSRRSGLRR